jgi:hypothetical protein
MSNSGMTIPYVPLENNYKGMSYGELAGEWWNWLLSENPDDPDEQKGPIFFTRGANRADKGADMPKNNIPTHEKDVKIPFGTAIFTGVCDAMFRLKIGEEKRLDTVAKMRKMANEHTSSVSEIGAIITDTNNGKKNKIVENLADFRVQSPLFRLNVPSNSKFMKALDEEIEPGTYDAVTDGYYILIKPLPVGKYKFEYYAKCNTGDYQYKSVYNISVDDVNEKSKVIDSRIDKSENMLSGK